MKPRLLDLFCGAGGCAKGYQEAGFYVVGVDNKPQPNYCGDDFVQDDALLALRGLAPLADVIHASPPCPRHSLVSGFQGVADKHPELVAPTRELLRELSVPWVIENVPGAPLRRDVVLCGEMFGLRVHRHRWFEVENAFVMQPRHSLHMLKGAKTNCDVREGVARWITGNYADHVDASAAMGIDWMGRKELAQAIPPAYTRFIGEALMTALKGVANAA